MSCLPEIKIETSGFTKIGFEIKGLSNSNFLVIKRQERVSLGILLFQWGFDWMEVNSIITGRRGCHCPLQTNALQSVSTGMSKKPWIHGN